MKKAFDANVSRARPKLRLGAMLGTTTDGPSISQETVESLAQAIAQEPVIPSREEPVDLSQALKAKLTARAFKPTAAEVLSSALQTEAPAAVAHVAVVEQQVEAVQAPVAVTHTKVAVEAVQAPEVVMAQPKPVVVTHTVRAAVEAPAEVREVQTAPLEAPMPDATDRREKLRERLKAVRENPRPEPLPETVAEAGVLAVERIAALQSELSKTRAMNLALSQDLEAARRQAERATEEARLRMDEARRLSAEMEGRVTLLADLEKELASLEGERNEALLALQESRQAIEAGELEKHKLRESLTAKDQELEASLQEEERLASELEEAHEAMGGLRRSADALKSERDTLARQVSDLTKERAELLEARKALEAVHRALAKASALA
jgi:myosin heavy subunit